MSQYVEVQHSAELEQLPEVLQDVAQIWPAVHTSPAQHTPLSPQPPPALLQQTEAAVHWRRGPQQATAPQGVQPASRQPASCHPPSPEPASPTSAPSAVEGASLAPPVSAAEEPSPVDEPTCASLAAVDAESPSPVPPDPSADEPPLPEPVPRPASASQGAPQVR